MVNRLAQETSPYLLQHKDNPVDWYPWSEEALTLARRQDKPILLSIGYSACHWCHVMAHESFEDPEVAAVMNAHFINIKVDREERPDLDQIYQLAFQMIARRGGGWPLTMFLSPQQVPFFGGTYFPRTPRYQMPGFLDLLPRVAAFYREHQDDISEQHTQILDALSGTNAERHADQELALAPLEDAARDLSLGFDVEWGGFGKAPKFPRPTELEFCLDFSQNGGPKRLAEMAMFTLRKMEQGGIYDQLGGGFCRYSVDNEWAIPHFEKMLYDNGPLLALYADAYALTGEPRFKEVCEQTVAWLVRKMRDPAGGFYSALDADSEHEEGKFYVWTPQQVSALLTDQEYAVVAPHYGLDRAANFEGHAWHFIIAQPLAEVAKALGISNTDADQVLTSARKKLFEARAKRVRPGCDDKVLTSWNALMIRGLALAARRFQRADWTTLAQQAVDFIHREMWREGRLMATYKSGVGTKLNAYLDDYAFLLSALIELMQTAFRPGDLAFTRQIADRLLDRFEDKEQGGFFFTAHDHESLIHRPKPGPDQATPSGNAMAVMGLQRLGHMLGEDRYLNASERALTLFYPAIRGQAAAYASFLQGLREHLSPPDIVILRGPEAAFLSWRNALASAYLPRSMLLFLPNTLTDLPPSLNKPQSETVNAWVCRGVSCLPAVNTPAALLALCKPAQAD